MESDMLTRGLLYLFLTVVGVPGNCTVIWAFLHMAYSEHKLLPADAIVLHLACANLLVVGVRCLLEILATFELANVFSDTGCKAVIFVYRTSRSLSIWLTFVLSAFQCLSIAPPGSGWAGVRALVARHLGGIFLFLWVLNTSMSSASIAFSLGSQNDSGLMQHGINVEFCFVRFPSRLSRDANGAVQVARDVVPMALMTAASLIILVFLYRHSQQVKSLRGGAGGGGGGGKRQGSSAEQRAAKAVVALVTMYVTFYGVDNGIWVYTLTVQNTLKSSLLSDVRIFFSSLYASVSPIVIIVTNRKVSKRLSCGREDEKPVQSADTALSTM
ncbi:olfactory receptor class A-like protein 1 [Anguilla rostrata]|uniref:olfactory receptor class A-like protein 1 n=1 Tax=Anguilla rostrata TaxID=7938 RepID=UPI0030D0BB77